MGDRPMEAGRPLGRGPGGGDSARVRRRPGGATTAPSDDRHLESLLTTFVEQAPGVVSAVVVTTDGLVLAVSDRMARDTADRLAAVTSGLASLTAGAARSFRAGSVARVIVEMAGGYLFVTTVGDGSALAVMCQADCEIGLIGYEMTLLAERIGPALTPALRARTTLAVPPAADTPRRATLPRRLPPGAA